MAECILPPSMEEVSERPRLLIGFCATCSLPLTERTAVRRPVQTTVILLFCSDRCHERFSERPRYW